MSLVYLYKSNPDVQLGAPQLSCGVHDSRGVRPSSRCSREKFCVLDTTKAQALPFASGRLQKSLGPVTHSKTNM